MRPVHLPPIESHTLPNGLRVYTATRSDLPLVSLLLITEAGAHRDPAGKEGLASLGSTLLLRGSGQGKPGDVSRAIEEVGGRIDAGTDRDRTVVSANALAEDLPLALELMAEVVTTPRFEPAEVEAAKRREIAELEQSKDDPSLLARRNLFATFLPPDHPYAAPVPGWRRTVAGLDREDLLGFHGTHFSPKTAFLVAVGDVRAEEVLPLAERFFGGWEGEEAPPPTFPASALERPRIRVIHKEDSTQTQIRLLGPAALDRKDPLFFPALVANTAFGGGFTSRLVNEIRVNRGLSYSVGTNLALLRRGGFFSFSSFTKNETVGELLSVLLEESRRAREGGFSPEELERAKRYMAGLYPLGLETNDQVAAAIAELILFDLEEDWVPRFRERIMAVEAGPAKEAAARLLFAQPFGLVLVGDRPSILRGLEAAGIEGEIEDLPIDEAA